MKSVRFRRCISGRVSQRTAVGVDIIIEPGVDWAEKHLPDVPIERLSIDNVPGLLLAPRLEC